LGNAQTTPGPPEGRQAFPVQIVGAPGFDAYALSRDMDLMVMLTNWERHWADGESGPVTRP